MATMAEEELGIELECAPCQSRDSSPTESSPTSMTATGDLHTTANGKAMRLRGGFEKDLKNEPIIVQFGGQAGAVVEH